MMAIVKPATVLRNYSKELDELQDGNPVVLTKNGVGKAVLMNIDEWERLTAEIRVLQGLHEAEQTFGAGTDLADFRSAHRH